MRVRAPGHEKGVRAIATLTRHRGQVGASARSGLAVRRDGSSDDLAPNGVLLTGATGFVGMELLARYLERTDRRVYALVRGA